MKSNKSLFERQPLFPSLVSLVFGALGATVYSCGKATTDKVVATPTATVASGGSGCNSTLKFADVESIITSTCATSSCHSSSAAAGSLALAGSDGKVTLAKVTANQSDMLARINDGSMPQGQSNWKDGTDGKKVISYLSCTTLK